MSLSGIELGTGILVGAPKALDTKYGPFTGVDIAAAKTAALTAVTAGFRFEGLTVGLIVTGQDIVEYQFKGGIADSNFVEKTSGGGDIYTLQADSKVGTSVPLTLDAATGTDSTVNLKEGANITLTRNSATEIEIEATGGGDTYTLQAEPKSSNSIPLKLDAATGTDSTVNFTEGTNITLTQNSATEITIDSSRLVTQQSGTSVDNNTNLINFVGSGVTATQISSGEVEVSIPGPVPGVSSFTNANGTYISAGTVNSAATGAVTVGTIDLSAVDGTSDTSTRFLSKDNTWDVPSYTSEYSWIIGDSGGTTRTLSNGEQLKLEASNLGLTVAVGPSATSPYSVRISNQGNFIISDDETVANTATVSTGQTSQIVKFKGTNGINTLVNSVTKELTISASGFQTETLTHNKMWAGNSSNIAYESDILEASNTTDSNYFSVIGDIDTRLIIGNTLSPVNLQTEIYSYETTSTILGRNNNAAYESSLGAARRSIVIGADALKQFDVANPPNPNVHNNFVVIGYGAGETVPANSHVRNSIIIGSQAAATLPAIGVVGSVCIGNLAGAKLGWRDIMIGEAAGSNALQSTSAFPNIAIGRNSYTSGDRGTAVGSDSQNGGRGVSLGDSSSGLVSTVTRHISIGAFAKSGQAAVSIGKEASALEQAVSVGGNAGEFWDDNTETDAENIFIGFESGKGSNTGDSRGESNIAIGKHSMRAAGYDGDDGLALQAVDRNICIGKETGEVLRSNSNIAIGHFALREYNQTHFANHANVVIGDEAGKSLVGTGNNTANLNVMIGSEAGTNLTDGKSNVLIGGQSGMTAVDSKNVIIGHRAQFGGGTITGVLSNAIIIGEEAYNDHSAVATVDAITIGNSSVGELKSTLLGASSQGAEGGLVLGYNANQRNKGAAGNSSYKNLISIGEDIASAFNDSSKGSAIEGGNPGNYCFGTNAEAVAAGLKHGDIYVESEGEGSNTPGDPARLCIVLQTTG